MDYIFLDDPFFTIVSRLKRYPSITRIGKHWADSYTAQTVQNTGAIFWLYIASLMVSLQNNYSTLKKNILLLPLYLSLFYSLIGSMVWWNVLVRYLIPTVPFLCIGAGIGAQKLLHPMRSSKKLTLIVVPIIVYFILSEYSIHGESIGWKMWDYYMSFISPTVGVVVFIAFITERFSFLAKSLLIGTLIFNAVFGAKSIINSHNRNINEDKSQLFNLIKQHAKLDDNQKVYISPGSVPLVGDKDYRINWNMHIYLKLKLTPENLIQEKNADSTVNIVTVFKCDYAILTKHEYSRLAELSKKFKQTTTPHYSQNSKHVLLKVNSNLQFAFQGEKELEKLFRKLPATKRLDIYLTKGAKKWLFNSPKPSEIVTKYLFGTNEKNIAYKFAQKSISDIYSINNSVLSIATHIEYKKMLKKYPHLRYDNHIVKGNFGLYILIMKNKARPK